MNFEEFHARPSVQSGPAAGEIAAQTIGKQEDWDDEHDGESVASPMDSHGSSGSSFESHHTVNPNNEIQNQYRESVMQALASESERSEHLDDEEPTRI